MEVLKVLVRRESLVASTNPCCGEGLVAGLVRFGVEHWLAAMVLDGDCHSADSIYSTAGEFDIWGELINFSAFGFIFACSLHHKLKFCD